MADLKMPEVNVVMIAGNLTNDPSFRRTTNGTPVANFSIASNRRFKDNNGNWRENVCYIGVVAWHKLAESCHESLQKGSAVLIDGEIQSRTWKNADGSSKNVVEIKARRIQFLNKRNSSFQSIIEDDEENEISTDKENNHRIDRSIDDDRESLENVTDGKLPNHEAKKTDRLPQDQQDDLDFGYSNLKL
jgi:single-strand DNA-binding protein